MSSARVFVTRAIPEAGLALLRAAPEVATLEVWPEDGPIPREELLRRVAGADALLPLLSERVDGWVLDAAGPRLRVVANYAVGFDNVDVAAATARGILVTNTPGALTDATADLTFALLLAVSRRIVEADRVVRGGGFPPFNPTFLLGADLAGKTLGIVGAGRIGTAVARRARGFDLRLVYTSRSTSAPLEELGATRLALDALLAASDFVTLHAPLNAETRHLIDARALSLMKPGAFLVNTARGPLVDEAALVQALRAGRIAGAALDVYEDEPRLASGLAELPNVVLAPHIGSSTHGARARMAVLAAEGVLAGLRGVRPAHLVDAQAWPGRTGGRPLE